jgi:hypothetical protein
MLKVKSFDKERPFSFFILERDKPIEPGNAYPFPWGNQNFFYK